MSDLSKEKEVSPPKVKRAVPQKSEYREKFKNRTLTSADLVRMNPPRRLVPLEDYSDRALTEGDGLEYD